MFLFVGKCIGLSLLLLSSRALCFTHWMVTDDGLTIHSVSDSPYHMAQPHSLVQFLDQERKLDAIAQARKLINEHEKIIQTRESADDPELEAKIRATDPNCIIGGTMSSNKDAFLSSYTLGKLTEDLDKLTEVELAKADDEHREPHCIYFLPFSMYAFEHLPSVQQRETLKIIPEAVFEKLLPYGTAIFGNRVAKALSMQPTSAPFLRLAALYWRIKGDAPKAVECFRRAAHFTNKDMQAQTWFDFGNLMHRAGYPADAIILYQLALSVVDNPTIHMALADAFALMQNRTEAIEQYNIAFSMDASMKKAQIKAAALKCDLKLIDAMEEQHKNLLDTIKEKNLYNDRYGTIKKMEESVRKNVADVDVRMQSALIYDYFTYGSLPYSICRSVTVSGRSAMQCSVSEWRRYRAARDDNHRKLVAVAKRNAEKKKGNAVRSSEKNAHIVKSLADSEALAAFLKHLEPFMGMDMNEPTNKPVYPLKFLPATNKILENYMSSSWPNETSCEANRWRFPIPTRAYLPELFISPENKGFKLSDLLTNYLGLSDGEEHPLPWHPPSCGTFISDKPLSATFMLSGVRAAEKHGHSAQLAENKIRQIFLHFLDGKAAEADIAQRIGTLMKYKIGPQWLVYNLAAVYWRSIGAPGEAVICLRAALQAEPKRYADVALVQLAQIVMRWGTNAKHYLDDTAAILDNAINIDPNEPATHFLMGVVKILQRRHSVALAYMRKAVSLDPMFQPAVAVLHALKCSRKNEQKPVVQRLHQRCCSIAEPDAFCFGTRIDGCFTVPKKNIFVATFCTTDYLKKEDCSRQATPLAPLLLFADPIKAKTKEAIKRVHNQLLHQIKFAEYEQSNLDGSVEIPLDYGANESFQKIKKMTTPSIEHFFQGEILFTETNMTREMDLMESWEEIVPVDKVVMPEWPLTVDLVPERRRMIVFDIPLPDILPLPTKEQTKAGLYHMPLPASRFSNNNFCSNVKLSLTMLREQSTSTWLSVTAKGVNLDDFVNFRAPVDSHENFEPVCPELFSPSPLRTLDHLPAYHLRDQFIHYKPEKALTDAFLKLGNEREPVEVVAKKLKNAMALSSKQNKDDGVHWALSTASALYWRVKGDAVNALKCLRHSLNTAPPNMSDVALVSMANIYQQAGLLHSALITGGAALTISPKLVAIHFTLANIYASLEKYQQALMFYYSTLSLQSNFEPAKERIRTIYCFTEMSVKL